MTTNDPGAAGLDRQVELEWVGQDEVPMQYVNQMLSIPAPIAGPRAVPDGIIVIFGAVEQPLLVGEGPIALERMQSLESVPVEVKGRFFMSRERAEELRNVLDMTIRQYDAAAAHGRGES